MLLNRDDLKNASEVFKKRFENQSKKILICAGTGGVSGGSLEIYDQLIDLMKERNINCEVSLEVEPHDESVGIKKSGCHGFCEMGPLVRIEPWGYLYIKVKPEDCQEILDKTILNNECVERLAYKKDGVIYKKQEEIPFYKKQTRLALEHCGHIDATSIEEYFAIGGYGALEKALFSMDSEKIINQIEESYLRGRGGGGFPTGRKWSLVKRQKEVNQPMIMLKLL